VGTSSGTFRVIFTFSVFLTVDEMAICVMGHSNHRCLMVLLFLGMGLDCSCG